MTSQIDERERGKGRWLTPDQALALHEAEVALRHLQVVMPGLGRSLGLDMALDTIEQGLRDGGWGVDRWGEMRREDGADARLIQVMEAERDTLGSRVGRGLDKSGPLEG